MNMDKIINDEKFLVELLNLKTSEEIKAKFKNEGIDITDEQSNDILELKNDLSSKKVTDDALEIISGGANSNMKRLSGALALMLTLGTSAPMVTPNAEAKTYTLTELIEKYPKVLTRKNYKSPYKLNVDEYAKLPRKIKKEFDTEYGIVNKFSTRIKLDALKPDDPNLLKKINILTGKGAAAVTDTAKEGLMTVAKTAIPIIGTAFVIKYAGDIIDHLKNFYASGSNAIKKLFYKLTHKGIDIKVYKTVLNRIEKRLRTELVGQDKAINEIIKIMTGYFESIVQAKEMGKKFEGGLILYLIGSPGTGKSTTMKIIEEEMGLDSYTGRMSDAIEDKGNGAQTVASRLIKPVIEDNGKVKVTVDTKLTNQVKSNVPTLYCLDEVDKMRVYDSVLQNRGMRNEQGKIIGGSVDEMLRNFGDTGQIAGHNASGSVLIATSNETINQMSELEGSLYNRYKGCTVEFTDFKAEDYREIILRKFKDIQEFYKTKFDTDISWSNSALKYYSETFEKENSGGRGVETLMNNARHTLKIYKDSQKSSSKKLILEYENNELKVAPSK